MNKQIKQNKSFYIGRLESASAEKCLFFKNDSYLSNYQVVFSQNPETTTNPFIENSNFTFGERFNE